MNNSKIKTLTLRIILSAALVFGLGISSVNINASEGTNVGTQSEVKHELTKADVGSLILDNATTQSVDKVLGTNENAKCKMDNCSKCKAENHNANTCEKCASGNGCSNNEAEKMLVCVEVPVVKPNPVVCPEVKPEVKDPVVCPEVKPEVKDPVVTDPVVKPVVCPEIKIPEVKDPVVCQEIKTIICKEVKPVVTDPVVKDPVVCPEVKPEVKDPVVCPVVKDPVVTTTECPKTTDPVKVTPTTTTTTPTTTTTTPTTTTTTTPTTTTVTPAKTLPQTGGLDPAMFLTFGTFLSIAGFSLKRK